MSPEERCTAADLMDFLSHSPKNIKKGGEVEPEHFMKENEKQEGGGEKKKQIR